MKALVVVMLTVAVISLLFVGCASMKSGATDLATCGKCGEIKGTAACCAPDAAKCATCDKTTGSPGCCVAD